jgi:hypothetical protein
MVLKWCQNGVRIVVECCQYAVTMVLLAAGQGGGGDGRGGRQYENSDFERIISSHFLQGFSPCITIGVCVGYVCGLIWTQELSVTDLEMD